MKLSEAYRRSNGRTRSLSSHSRQNTVEEQTDVEKIGLDQVLGHAIAHEIGHILLGSNSHGSRGLMKAKWGQEDIKRAGKGDLLFTPEQAQVIQNNLAKLARTYSPKRQ